jgi:hypothetical protein
LRLKINYGASKGEGFRDQKSNAINERNSQEPVFMGEFFCACKNPKHILVPELFADPSAIFATTLEVRTNQKFECSLCDVGRIICDLSFKHQA